MKTEVKTRRIGKETEETRKPKYVKPGYLNNSGLARPWCSGKRIC